MKRFQLIALAMMLMISLGEGQPVVEALPAESTKQTKAAEKTLRQRVNEAQRTATRLLDSRPLVVRIYPDPAGQPERFQRVTVRLKGLSLRYDTIKAAFSTIKSKTPVVALGADQTDRVVAAVMADFVFAGAYKSGASLSIWPPRAEDPGHAYWEFLDALGSPLPKATVEIALYVELTEARIVLGTGTLDEQGQLKRLKRGCSSSRFVFTVSHPDYGTAKVEYSGMPTIRDSPKTYVVPLVPLNSDAVTRAIQGFVLDSEERPVAGIEIWASLQSPTGSSLEPCGRFQRTAVTDKRGWFALYAPVAEGGVLSDRLLPAGSTYHIGIIPEKSLNLAQYEGNMIAGASTTIYLSALRSEEFYHTFAFEGRDGPIRDLEQLKRTVITLWRDNREWVRLTYEQWKDGCSLPSGILCAETVRAGYPFSFEAITLHAASPEQLVFREHPPILYRGKVVVGATDQPMPNTLVLTNQPLAPNEQRSLTAEQVQRLREYVSQAPSTRGGRMVEEYQARALITDAEGRYEIVFLPGSRNIPPAFTALAPGYPPCSVQAGSRLPDVDGIVEVPTIRLAPAEPSYSPKLVFQDETGPVTDPNKLKSIRFEVSLPNGHGVGGMYEGFFQQRPFQPGIFHATAMWDGRYYIFEPVDLREARPGVVVFKPAQILDGFITYQGLVVDGVTGRPIPQAVVIHDRLFMKYDLSPLTAEQWTAIESLGPEPNSTDPALAPLVQLVSDGNGAMACQIALADAQGWFRIALKRAELNMPARLLIAKRDFLATEQQLVTFGRTAGDRSDTPFHLIVEPDKNGLVTLPPLKLFPAGTLLLEPVLPDQLPILWRKPRVAMHLLPAQEDQPPWLKDYGAMPNDNYGASVVRPRELRPNVRQSIYVPAGVSMTVLVYALENSWAARAIPDISATQGQVLELGRIELDLGVEVVVKVVDSRGNPIKNMRVSLFDERLGPCGQLPPTGMAGTTTAHLPPSSQGKFTLYCYYGSPPSRVEASAPYRVGGQEDAGREFLLPLSDELLAQLLQANQRR